METLTMRAENMIEKDRSFVLMINQSKIKANQSIDQFWLLSLILFQQVQAAIEKAKGNPRLRSLLVKLQDYPNIPRKKAKFEVEQITTFVFQFKSIAPY